MTIVDTSVLLDVLLQDSRHADESAKRLGAALDAGPVAVNEIIAAELAPAFDREETLWRTLDDASVAFQSFPKEAVFLAGRGLLGYRRRGGTRDRILAVFLIAAHAQTAGAALLTRDRGFYRSYFPKLRLA